MMITFDRFAVGALRRLTLSWHGDWSVLLSAAFRRDPIPGASKFRRPLLEECRGALVKFVSVVYVSQSLEALAD